MQMFSAAARRFPGRLVIARVAVVDPPFIRGGPGKRRMDGIWIEEQGGGVLQKTPPPTHHTPGPREQCLRGTRPPEHMYN